MKKSYLITKTSIFLLFVSIFCACHKKSGNSIVANVPEAKTPLMQDIGLTKSKVDKEVKSLVVSTFNHLNSDLQKGHFDKEFYEKLFAQINSELQHEGIKLSGIQSPVMQKVLSSLSLGVMKVDPNKDGISLDFIQDTLDAHLKLSNSLEEQSDMMYAASLFENIAKYALNHNDKLDSMQLLINQARYEGKLLFFEAKNGIGWARFKCRIAHMADVARNSQHAVWGAVKGLFDEHDCSANTVKSQLMEEVSS